MKEDPLLKFLKVISNRLRKIELYEATNDFNNRIP